MKIAILGAGISGLSIAKLLKDSFDVQLFERDAKPGGIAKTEWINNVAFHNTGGHCFNSNYTEVLDFVFGKVMPREEWNVIERKAQIQLNGFDIPYPIEYALKDIYKHDADLALNIASDYFSCDNKAKSKNLSQWFENNFGKALTELYFRPYNEKIWNKKLEEMSPIWVEDKLPVPNKTSVLRSFFERESDKMPHRFFFYPKSNDQNTFIDKLAQDLNINYNYLVNKIDYNPSTKKWSLNNQENFDLIISTIPLNILPQLISNVPSHIINHSKKLKYNKLTTMLWESQPTKSTWTYIPDKNKLAHRYIHIGNFFNPVQNFTITEAVGTYSFEEMAESEKNNPFFIKPITHHISDHAYVIFDHDYEEARKEILNYLHQINLYTLGRFGEWQYYNMDICIKRSLEFSKEIIEKYS